MPKHHEVPSLQNLCLTGVASLVVNMAPSIELKIHKYIECLDQARQLLATVPCLLHDALAKEVLEIIQSRIENEEEHFSSTKMQILVGLSTVVVSSHLKSVNLSSNRYPKWPRIMRNVLFRNLHKMLGLENIVIDDIGRTKYIINSFSKMKNLRRLVFRYNCTDSILQAVAKGCPYLELLDVSKSEHVSNDSVPYLLKCQHLRQIKLSESSITVSGYAQLIAGLPKLENLGYFNDLDFLTEYLTNVIDDGFVSITKVDGKWLSPVHLKLLVKLFPKLQSVRLMPIYLWDNFPDPNIDLTIFNSLENLNCLKLQDCFFDSRNLVQFLQVNGNNINSLCLRVLDLEFSLRDVVVYIGMYCPNLKILHLDNDFYGEDNFPLPSVKLKVHPFQNLEELSWNVYEPANGLELILAHALNIRFVKLIRCRQICNDIFNALTINPMKQLEQLLTLDVNDINMKLIESLLANCQNIKVLADSATWNVTEEEIVSLKEHISSNNLDLLLEIHPNLDRHSCLSFS